MRKQDEVKLQQLFARIKSSEQSRSTTESIRQKAEQAPKVVDLEALRKLRETSQVLKSLSNVSDEA